MPPLLLTITRFHHLTHLLDKSVNPGGDASKVRGAIGVSLQEPEPSTNYHSRLGTALGSVGHSPWNSPSNP